MIGFPCIRVRQDRSGSILPLGTIVYSSSTSIPPDWLMLDGGIYLNEDYPDFAALIASLPTGLFQIDDTCFILPDLRGKVIKQPLDSIVPEPEPVSDLERIRRDAERARQAD